MLRAFFAGNYRTMTTQTERVKNVNKQLICHNWYKLYKVTFDYLKNNGSWQTQSREAYDRGNGATILLYNKVQKTVILTRQFRLPTYVNGNNDGMLIEACAGLLDLDNAEDCICRETEEETGYKVTDVRKVFEAYMSPGSVTEKLYFFVAEYTASQKVHDGGGIEHEQEDIEVLELTLAEALQMITDGRIQDGKTIMLLQYAALQALV